VGKKIVFAVAYIVCALFAYGFFFDFSMKKYQEEYAILEAEWIAMGRDPRWMEYWFFDSVWGKGAVGVGIALLSGGLIGEFIILSVSDVRSKKRKKES